MYKENGSVYIGHFEHGKANGKGAYVFPDGSFYQGEFRHNVAETANGKYHSDENVYEGGFKENRFTGKGVEQGKNFRYEGFFENGTRKEGTLEWEDESGKYKYTGHFNSNNEFHGNGTYIFMQECSKNLKEDMKELLWTDKKMDKIVSIDLKMETGMKGPMWMDIVKVLELCTKVMNLHIRDKWKMDCLMELDILMSMDIPYNRHSLKASIINNYLD